MRKKKTPEELAAEAEQEDLDDFTSKYWDRPSFSHMVKRALTEISIDFPLFFKQALSFN
jgi:hypothetical protein